MLYRIALTLWLVFSGVLFCIARMPLVPLDIDTHYHVRDPLPDYVQCVYWPYHYIGELDCGLPGYSFTISSPMRLITHVTRYVLDDHVTAGDLLLRWGPPIAERRYGYWRSLYWQGRYAYIFSHPFTPFSRVSIIAWDDTGMVGRKWEGFTQ